MVIPTHYHVLLANALLVTYNAKHSWDLTPKETILMRVPPAVAKSPAHLLNSALTFATPCSRTSLTVLHVKVEAGATMDNAKGRVLGKR